MVTTTVMHRDDVYGAGPCGCVVTTTAAPWMSNGSPHPPHTLPAWIMIVTVMNRDDDDEDGHRGCQCDGAGAIADTVTRSAHQLDRSASNQI